MKSVIILLLVFVSIFSIVHGQELSKPVSFKVINVNREIVVNGILEKEEWASIDSIVGFLSPWSSAGKDQTIFKSFCSDSDFYFCFKVNDETLTTNGFTEESTVEQEDRVELFFSATSELNQYYCIEVDPLGRVLDYSAQYYRRFDDSWDFRQINISTHYTYQGYIVEGSISLSKLAKLGLKESFFLGIFRADFRSNRADDVIWYSWIEPKSQIPDFHIPTAFGICNFIKN